MRRRLGVRSRLLIAVVAVVGVGIAALVGAFNVVLAGRLSASATTAARARAEAELQALEIRHGRIALTEAPDAGVSAGEVWIFDTRGRALEAPRAPAALRRAARTLAASGARVRDDSDSEARLYAVPVVRSQRRLGTVVAAVSTEPYTDTKHTALLASLALALVLLVAIALVARWILRAALAPVRRMTASAAAWSERDVGRRFALGDPYDELTELAATLDSLLERLAASLRHEQRFAAELSHELRTPLARIGGEAELALARPRDASEYRDAFESVARDAEQMTRIVDALVAAARQESGLTRASSDARDAVLHAVETSTPLAESSAIRMTVDLPRAPVRVPLDTELVERILQPLLDNACHYGRLRVDVSLAREGQSALVTVADDGPGVSADERARIFEPGARGSASNGRHEGSGLGLALALRIAEAAGGTIAAEPADGGRFVLTLPLA